MNHLLATYVRRRRRSAVTRSVGWAIATVIVCGWTACAADRLRPLSNRERSSIELCILITAVGTVARPVLRALFGRTDLVAAATAIERLHPSLDHRLVTAASSTATGELRAALDADVSRQMAAIGRLRVPARPTVIAWVAALSTVAATAGLWRWPWLDLPDLSRRLVCPAGDVPPVTAVRLTVRPGQAVVIDGRPLTVTAVVTGIAAATLHVSTDGRTWAEQPMHGVADGRLATTVSGLDHDGRYYVTAGDAVSPTYAVRVLPVPAVVTFRVTVGRTASDDATGHVDVPAGAAVTVDVVATVPLRAAIVSVGRQRFATRATADPAVRRATFTAVRDAPLDVRLTSADGVTGSGPRGARVRVYDPADVPGFDGQQRAFRDALRRPPATRPATRT